MDKFSITPRYEKCPFRENHDCFGRWVEALGYTERCHILTEQAFIPKNLKEWDDGCPFYKTHTEYVRGLEIYGGFKNGKY